MSDFPKNAKVQWSVMGGGHVRRFKPQGFFSFDESGTDYRIYSINRPGRLLNFWTLRVGAYSRWALIRSWALIKFSAFSASVVCLFCNKTINGNDKTQRCNKAKFL